jgi:hypothetical protein
MLISKGSIKSSRRISPGFIGSRMPQPLGGKQQCTFIDFFLLSQMFGFYDPIVIKKLKLVEK